jgi:hypothetical protein
LVKIYDIIPPAIPSAGVYLFTTDNDIQYEVRFGRKQNDSLSATIVFGVLNDEYDGEEYVTTNKGELYDVMNTIVLTVKMFMKEHPNIRRYEFTGEPTSEEPDSLAFSTKRIKLYARYVKRIFDDNWNIVLDGNKIIVTKK